MFNINVRVVPKAGILDPQGVAIQKALPALGYDNVSNIRVGRFISLSVDTATAEQARVETSKMCEALLANTIIEDYEIEGY